MNLCIINTLYTPNLIGGAERSVQSLAEGILKAGHKVTVVTTAQTDAVRNVNGVKVFYLKLRNLYWPFGNEKIEWLKPIWHILDTYNPLMGGVLGRILDSQRPDLVHTHSLAGFSITAWEQVKLRKIPLVHTLRDFHLACARSNMYRNGHNCQKSCWDCRLYGALRRLASDQVDAVVGISQFILARHLNLGYFRSVPIQTSIYNSYDANTETSFPKEANHPIRFGFMGRLEPSKGLNFLLKELPPNATLWVAGKGDPNYETHLRKHWASKNIKFCGYMDADRFLSLVDVLVVPSLWHEPFGRVIIEAYANGVPVIGSNRGAIPELINERKTGFIFDPDQVGELNAILEKIIKEPDMIKSMNSPVRQKAKEFRSCDTTRNYSNVYQSLLHS